MSRQPTLALLLPWALLGSLAAQVPTMIHTAQVGRLEVTTLKDGEFQLPLSYLKDIAPELAKGLAGGRETATTPVCAFLVKDHGHLILVDTGGSAAAMGPNFGHMLERLKSAGVSPEAIEAVLITHLHGDHTGGLLTADGKRAFPKAVLRVAQAESDYWLDPKTLASLPEARKGMVAQFKAGIAPYQAAGAYQPFAPSEAPFPGVTAISAHGHTPGHTVYGFGDPKQPFWVVGDIVHVGAVQFSHPEATLIFDWDSGMAAGTRLELWKRAAREGAVLGATHLPFPGLGHVQTEGSAFAWVPLP